MTKKITALKIQKRNRKRVNLFLDDKFAFGLSTIVAAWLKVGQEVSDQKIAQLMAEDGKEIALQRALNFLSYRPRSAKEVRDNLRKHKTESAVIDAIIQRLHESGMLNDTEFAKLWVENRSEFRPRGKALLRMELRRKGLEDDLIAESIQDVDEDGLALRAAKKQARKYRNLEWQEFRKKMLGFLARRGFNYGTIAEVLPRIWDEMQAPDSE